ncbi:thialysine N-epsilon-acetyltransferase [Microplitis mediator]|uniref:thialysine N-epsilon-acetyltransferase n=1 Tax=Microplitis mediator TaxID=375433 RepID=UPI0025579C12|nr:thialysine N-epsilon-acetyltransferase [Microplitis mediator]
MDKLEIRETRREDCHELRALIQKLADFEKMPDGPKLDAKDLERDGFGRHPLFHSFVAEINNQLVGYAIYYYTFSTWRGKSMFLDELYVLPSYQKKRIGSLLFQAVVKKASDSDCCRLDFTVLNWNPAVDFYKSKGVIDITESDKWHLYRLDVDGMTKLLQN